MKKAWEEYKEEHEAKGLEKNRDYHYAIGRMIYEEWKDRQKLRLSKFMFWRRKKVES